MIDPGLSLRGANDVIHESSKCNDLRFQVVVRLLKGNEVLKLGHSKNVYKQRCDFHNSISKLCIHNAISHLLLLSELDSCFFEKCCTTDGIF